MGFCEVLTIVFVVLKLMGIIEWAWIWVLLPEIIAVAIYIVVVIISIVIRISAEKRVKRFFK